jgi:hypothetical protein
MSFRLESRQQAVRFQSIGMIEIGSAMGTMISPGIASP